MASQVSLIQSIYDERSENYDNSHHGALAEAYIRTAEPKDGESVLDLACGTGLVSFLAEKKVGTSGHVVGIDISPGMLDVARRKAHQAGSEVTFLQHDISHLTGLDILPPGSDGFDLITCAAALVLLPDPAQAIKNWAVWLKPGGRLVTDVAAKDVHVPSRILRRISDDLGVSLQWDESWVQDERSLGDLLASAGLAVKTLFLTKSFQDRVYKVADAGEAFDKAVSSPMFRNFGRPAIRDEAKRLFVEKFTEEAGLSGVLIDEAKMYMAVAHKDLQ
ncbi:S-adenosyl-L-methionine-dependent methyltransferase [Aspergillus sclerotioniger CBS 115572]|uniref:S-adenosyl-L-methionine-dependent methyltransferase n=1 Tax=Aspergillus sclerotioniger CBS 115572 TaxID=1450535 RepID=A0A317V466_9EURO|nr:S-adenosyl-L-methionine-dependent methyltransferase [Aspergillus sclerotioniger CBS 115572]PWY67592.1 S-adenosyl-L-methionine-dependent methyltransferase [Aspergillus sclerotioniger CBS 115572]